MPKRSFWSLKRGDEARTTGQSLGQLTELVRSRPEQGKFLRNKAGRGVVTGRLEGRKVKVYQAFGFEHAAFIAALSEMHAKFFPKVLTTSGRWVFAEWVEGKDGTRDIPECARILAEVHKLDTAELPQPGFDYLGDYIIPRFRDAACLGGDAARFDDIIARVKNFDAKSRFSHPDLTPANVIQTEAGAIIIDNELVSIGTLPLLDACNCVKNLRRQERPEFWSHWITLSPPSEKEVHVTALAWMLREIGSRFITGDFNGCHDLLQKLETDPMFGLQDLTFPEL
ncbi:MAG: phosphotransferase [Pseudomonadota bacterium]